RAPQDEESLLVRLRHQEIKPSRSTAADKSLLAGQRHSRNSVFDIHREVYRYASSDHASLDVRVQGKDGAAANHCIAAGFHGQPGPRRINWGRLVQPGEPLLGKFPHLTAAEVFLP